MYSRRFICWTYPLVSSCEWAAQNRTTESSSRSNHSTYSLRPEGNSILSGTGGGAHGQSGDTSLSIYSGCIYSGWGWSGNRLIFSLHVPGLLTQHILPKLPKEVDGVKQTLEQEGLHAQGDW